MKPKKLMQAMLKINDDMWDAITHIRETQKLIYVLKHGTDKELERFLTK